MKTIIKYSKYLVIIITCFGWVVPLFRGVHFWNMFQQGKYDTIPHSFHFEHFAKQMFARAIVWFALVLIGIIIYSIFKRKNNAKKNNEK